MRPARYSLRRDDGMAALAQWLEMDGFFVGGESAYDAFENPSEEPGTVRLTLRGVDWLDAAADRPTRTLELGDAVLEVLAGNGHVLGDYSLWGARLTVPSGSPDATLTAGVGALPHVGGEWAWDQWRASRPAQRNAWARLPVGHREAWLEVTRIVSFRENRMPYPALLEQIDLDGGHVDDLASLFCALGDAVAGPGGWCASSLADLADCLRYAPRAAPRPRLLWRDLAVAEKGLARTVAEAGAVRYLDLALQVLAGGGVEVLAG
ncbi:MAG TPA: hypothetical protein VH561_03425 [Micromonosporaceae bacterium]